MHSPDHPNKLAGDVGVETGRSNQFEAFGELLLGSAWEEGPWVSYKKHRLSGDPGLLLPRFWENIAPKIKGLISCMTLPNASR